MAGKKAKEDTGRSVTRKGEQLVGVLRDDNDGKDFMQRVRAKCEEARMKAPPMIPYGKGERIAVACKSRDQAIFVFDFAEEAIAEMNAESKGEQRTPDSRL